MASLFGKKKFGTMALKELRFGFVRVSDWYRQSLSVRQALYTVYDSEVLVRDFWMAIMSEMRLRGFAAGCGRIDIGGDGWWEWVVDCELDYRLVQKARDTEDGKVKKMESVWWWGWVIL